MTTTTPAPAQPVTRRRSPIVYIRLCPLCAGYQPFTPEDYWGALSGICQGCGSSYRELHRFAAVIHAASGCNCTTAHKRVTGDLDAASVYDEAADDRTERAGTGCRECAESAQRYCGGCQDLLDTAGEYRELRDELIGACRNAG